MTAPAGARILAPMDPKRAGAGAALALLILTLAGVARCRKRADEAASVPHFLPAEGPTPLMPRTAAGTLEDVTAARRAAEKAKADADARAAAKAAEVLPPRLRNIKELQADIRRYYPEEERKAGKEGRVMVAMTVGADGKVRDARVETSGGAAFDAAALKVAAAMAFHPATRGGKPVAVEISEGIDFAFDGKPKGD